MNLHVIIGQRKERYEGQYAPEALDCMDEYGVDENPEWLRGKLEEHQANGEFEAVCVFVIEIDDDAVMAGLRPAAKTLEGKVVSSVAP